MEKKNCGDDRPFYDETSRIRDLCQYFMAISLRVSFPLFLTSFFHSDQVR